MRAARASAMAVAWGTPTPSTSAVVDAAPAPTPDEDAGGAGAHQVQGGLVAGARRRRCTGTSSWRMNVLRLRGSHVCGDVLGRHHGAPDDQQVELGLEHLRQQRLDRWGVTAPAATPRRRGSPRTRSHDELGLDRLLRRSPGGGGGGLVGAARRSRRAAARGPRSGSTAPRGRGRATPPISSIADGVGRAHHAIHGAASTGQVEPEGLSISHERSTSRGRGCGGSGRW